MEADVPLRPWRAEVAAGQAVSACGERESTRSVLEIRPKISAIVAVNDATAFGVINEAQRLVLKISGDLSITGFDEVSWASIAHPPLTTVHITF